MNHQQPDSDSSTASTATLQLFTHIDLLLQRDLPSFLSLDAWRRRKNRSRE